MRLNFRRHFSLAFALVLVACVVAPAFAPRAQKRRGRARPAKICFDPTAACPVPLGDGIFEPYDLAFEFPQNTVIWETQQFYVVILKSVRVREDDCEKFVPEAERLEAQKLFPRRKVFTSRCSEPVRPYYTNVAPDQRFMAVYAGSTRAEAERTLAAVRAAGKFPGANLRRVRAGLNGT